MKKKRGSLVWLYIVLIFFVGGYLLGAFLRPGVNSLPLIPLFMLANIASYQSYQRRFPTTEP